MRIKKELLEELDAMGIRVRCYACSDEEMRNKIFKERYLNYLPQFADQIYPNMKEEDFNDDQKSKAREKADKWTDDEMNQTDGWWGIWYNSTEFYITYVNDRMIKRTCGKNEEITKERVMKLIERDKKAYQGAYGEFTDKMRKLLKADGKLSSFNIYPTTYGIGVWVFYNWNLKDDLAYIDKKLKSLGIEYYNEYSEARWVFRYKISKKQANLSKIA